MKSYADEELAVGDQILCIVGRHFKIGIIEQLIEKEGWQPMIVIKGIKTRVHPSQCIKYYTED